MACTTDWSAADACTSVEMQTRCGESVPSSPATSGTPKVALPGGVRTPAPPSRRGAVIRGGPSRGRPS